MKLVLWSLLILGTISGGGYVLYQTHNVPEPATETVSAASAANGPERPAGIQGLGYVEPVNEVRRLAFKVGGIISKVEVEIGQQVPLGSMLAELENAEEEQSVRVAMQQLAVAKAEQARILRGVNENRIVAAEQEAVAWQARLDLYERELERTEKLHRSNTATESQFDEAQMRVREAKATIAKAEAEIAHLRTYVLPEERDLAREEVQLAQCNLDLAKAKLENTRLVAPIGGTVLEILKREGESVTAETREPVIVFADLSRLRVRAEIDERNAHGLREGQAAVVFGRNLGGQRFHGRVSCVKRLMGGKTVFARTATERKDLDAVQVFIDFEQPFAAPVGLRVDVAIQVGEAREPPFPVFP